MEHTNRTLTRHLPTGKESEEEDSSTGAPTTRNGPVSQPNTAKARMTAATEAVAARPSPDRDKRTRRTSRKLHGPDGLSQQSDQLM